MKLKFALSLLMGGCAFAALAQGGYQDGVDYYNADRFEKARTVLEKTLNDAATNKAVSYYYLGALDMREGKMDAAKANFNKGIAVDPNCGYNYVGLGEIALKNGNKGEANNQFQTAIKLDKKDYAVKAAIARAYFNVDPVAYKGEIDDYIKKAMKDSKNLGTAVYVLQGDMAKDTNVGQAAGYYEQAIQFEEQAGNVNPEAYVKYANLYNKVNNAYSISKLEELNQKLPTSALAQSELAEKYYDSELYSKAAAQYKKYMDNPNHFQSDEQRYCGLLFFDNKNEESLAIAKQVLAKDPSNHYMYRMVMLNDKALGRNEEAAEYGAKLMAVKDVPLTATDYNTYAAVLVALGRNDEAAQVYHRAYNADPVKFESMLTNLSDHHTAQKEYVKAAEYLEQYVAGGNHKLNDLYDLANLYGAAAQQAPEGSAERTEYLNKGIGYLDQVIEKSVNKAPIYKSKARLLRLRDGDKVSKEQADTWVAMLEAYETENPEAKTKDPNSFKLAYSMLATYAQQNKQNPQEWIDKLNALGD